MSRSMLKNFTTAATVALCLTTAGTAAAIAPPPFIPPSSGDAAPAVQSAPAPQDQAQQQTAPASSDTATQPAESGPAPVQTANTTDATAPPVITPAKNVVKKTAKRHRARTHHSRRVRRHHARRGVHAAMTDGAHPGVSCGYQSGTRNQVVWNDAPAQRPDAGLEGQYVAYQPSYYWFDFSTRQWRSGGAGNWVWTYSEPSVYGSVGYHTFDGQETQFDGSQSIYVTPGYYWRVAIRTYWYPTGTIAGHFGPYDWAGDHTAFFPPAYSDGFSAILDQTQQVVDQWCWVPAS